VGRSYRILVAAPQVPFLRGGAELHAELTVKALAEAGHEVELLTVPYTWTADASSLRQAMAWRLIDFEKTGPGRVDLLVATKYPSYLGRHHNKVAWIFHQQREVYDLHATRFGNFGLAEEERSLRQALVELDLEALGEARALFTNSGNTADRLMRYCGVQGQALYAPPPLHDRLRTGDYGDYLFFIGRLDPLKRLDLTIRALAHTRHPVQLRVAGRGPHRDKLIVLAEELGVADRVTFLGFVTDEEVIEQYAGAFGMVLTPHDEDYGFTTLEAFFAGKPVVTVTDAGGVLEFVRDGETGFVVDTDPEQIAERIDQLYDDRALCKRLGTLALQEVREKASWPKAVAALTATLD
jgi:glycosyltransferase involved in cell wall biosynthesis